MGHKASRGVSVVINTDGAAFDDPDGGDGPNRAEVARVLRRMAQEIVDGKSSGVLADTNGNVCARFRLKGG